MPRNNRQFFDRLIAARFQKDKVSKIIQDEIKHEQQASSRRQRQARHGRPQYLTGTRNGVFYRIPIPSGMKSKPLPSIPKLHTPISPPMRLTPIGESSSSSSSSTASVLTHAKHRSIGSSSNSAKASAASSSASELVLSSAEKRHEFWERLAVWFKDNYGTLILNFGSICTLIGFTRSDVLELRYLSVTGSVCAIAYHFANKPLRIPVVLWSSTFAAVNSFKIFEILQERKGSVQLTQEQEEIYINFFMPHGITPKQFELIYQAAHVLHVKKGECLVRQNAMFHHVDLVVAGTTRASVLGRFLTAASTTPTAHEERAGGASGAWIGEMSLLERVWIQDNAATRQLQPTKRLAAAASAAKAGAVVVPKDAATTTTTTTATRKVTNASENADKSFGDTALKHKSSAKRRSDDEKTPFQIPVNTEPTKPKASHAMYTIVAQEDCTVLRWSHADMQALMERSTDMRAALTRAMTAAIVAKVINFTVSRASAKATWATWLDDWKYSAGAQVQISADERHQAAAEEDDEQTESPKENLPRYPIKRFG